MVSTSEIAENYKNVLLCKNDRQYRVETQHIYANIPFYFGQCYDFSYNIGLPTATFTRYSNNRVASNQLGCFQLVMVCPDAVKLLTEIKCDLKITCTKSNSPPKIIEICILLVLEIRLTRSLQSYNKTINP